ncbi:GNAT family N-acetyltransferase [Streptomyces sp. SAI-041]|uniref:GNAT family N-acetyltransferase n=1 Tax=Streptomyces sp. SAI-041 TaxID=2940548 RepID=UPI0024754512|nr:GNAT family N-acetyltransferase [Streptomyces sp. SAI-041]MDH6554775.1 GNAT superfamily N-acetyltransferase [Streptomyces sp. SAI-041]
MNSKDDRLTAMVSAYADAFADLAAATTGRTRRGTQGSVLAISGAPTAALNLIVSPSPEPSAEEIAALAAAESPWEVPWSIQVRGVPGPRIAEAAARHGLTHFEREPLMVRRPDEGLPEEQTVDGLRVRVVPVNELDRYARTVAAGFEAPYEMFEVLAEPSLGETDGLAFYLAELDGVPVGTGMTAISGDLTGIFNITTLPSYRRRGYGRVITLEMVRAGFAAGAGTAYLYASEMGEPVYQSVGFRTQEYLTVISAPS